MAFASIVAFFLVVHAMLAFGMGDQFRYDQFFEFVGKGLGSGICLALATTAGVFSFLWILGVKTGSTAVCRASLLVSVTMWATLAIYQAMAQPEALNDVPPIVSVALTSVIAGLGYPFFLILIMGAVGSWFGFKVDSTPNIAEGAAAHEQAASEDGSPMIVREHGTAEKEGMPNKAVDPTPGTAGHNSESSSKD
jgi:hypothetical protein